MLPRLLDDMNLCSLFFANFLKLSPTSPSVPILLDMFTMIMLFFGSVSNFLTTTGSASSPLFLKFWYIVSYSCPSSCAARE